MTKSELVKRISRKTGLPKRNVAMAMDTLTETIIEIAGEGDKVLWSGFGTFAIMERAGRRGRNPKTGEEIEIEPRRTLRFRPSKMLEESWR